MQELFTAGDHPVGSRSYSGLMRELSTCVVIPWHCAGGFALRTSLQGADAGGFSMCCNPARPLVSERWSGGLRGSAPMLLESVAGGQ